MVREVPFEELASARREVTVGEPWGDAEISSLLDEAKRLIMRAVPTRFFAAFAEGEVAAYCEVRSDGTVAQIEDVNTIPRFRRRGLGRAVVQYAVGEARSTNDVVYLEALAEDWPRQLYAKLGFDVVGERHFNTLFPHPLTRLRVRTPRLELRLATRAELRALGELAQRGIHDPAEMPFGVAWTDDSDRPGFVDESVGAPLVSPRGVPVEPTDLELRRENFRSPVEVEIVALEPLLPLFGAA